MPARRVLAILFTLLPATFAAAQSAPNEIAPSARALLFQVHSNLTVEGFSGATLSLKWHEDAATARRLGFTVDGDLLFSEDRSRQSLQIEGDFLTLRYRRSRTPIYLYHGIGPAAGLRMAFLEINENRNDVIEVSAGVGGALGVEWLVSPSIGLVAEYHAAALISVGRRPIGQDEHTTEFGLRLDSRGARAGASVYF